MLTHVTLLLACKLFTIQQTIEIYDTTNIQLIVFGLRHLKLFIFNLFGSMTDGDIAQG